MNGGGLAAAVLPSSTSVVAEESKTSFNLNGMTYDDERLSARWKERRARFLGCIENTKLIAERTKQRQENARQERLKKERAEMEKYRRRYLEAAMKQYMEHQAKTREATALMAHSHNHQHHSQLLPPAQAYSGCMHATRAPLTSYHPSLSGFKPNNRKRSFENGFDWTQYAQMAMMYDQHNAYSGKESQIFQNVLPPPIQNTNPLTYPDVMSRPVSYFSSRSNSSGNESSKTMIKEITHNNDNVHGLERSEQYDQIRLGNSMLPTTSQTQAQGSVGMAPIISEEINHFPTMPELAESHMRDLMDQFGPGNSLDDLGENCLEGVLISRCDEQPSTEVMEADGLNMHSATSSVISAMSVPCGTPNSAISPTHIPSSVRCSTSSVYESHNTAVTPRQTAVTSCDQHQQMTMNQTVVPVTHLMAQENPIICNSNVNSNNGGINYTTNATTILGNNVGNISTCSNSDMYSNAPSTVSISPSHMQQHYSFPYFQQHQQNFPNYPQQPPHHRDQLQLLNNGCHMSANNMSSFSHLDNIKLYSGNECSRFGQSYNLYDSCPTKSSIFPRFSSQPLIRYGTPHHYGTYPVKCSNSVMSYYPQQQEMGAEQLYSLPSFESTVHHHHQESDPSTIVQNPVYPLNQF